MAYKRQIIEISEKLNVVDVNNLLFHKNRLLILLKRVKTIVDLVEKNISESTQDLVTNQSMMLLFKLYINRIIYERGFFTIWEHSECCNF